MATFQFKSSIVDADTFRFQSSSSNEAQAVPGVRFRFPAFTHPKFRVVNFTFPSFAEEGAGASNPPVIPPSGPPDGSVLARSGNDLIDRSGNNIVTRA